MGTGAALEVVPGHRAPSGCGRLSSGSMESSGRRLRPRSEVEPLLRSGLSEVERGLLSSGSEEEPERPSVSQSRSEVCAVPSDMAASSVAFAGGGGFALCVGDEAGGEQEEVVVVIGGVRSPVYRSSAGLICGCPPVSCRHVAPLAANVCSGGVFWCTP